MSTKRKASRKQQAAPQEQALQKLESTTAVQKLPSQTELENYARRTLAESAGVKDLDLCSRIIDQVSRTQAAWPFGNAREGFQVAVEMLQEIRPESLLESMLAAQVIGVHHAILSCLQRTALQAKSSEDLDAFSRVTARFMHLFMEQLEAMAKLKGKAGQQKITVEHVEVHSGGQAIVGAVGLAELNQGEGGHGKKRKKTP